MKDQLFTPLLTFASIANTLQAYEREFGVATFLVRGTAQVRGHGAVAIDDVFAGDSPAIGAAASVSGPLSLLLRNERQPVQIDGVELAIQSFEEPRTASIERVWLGTPRAEGRRDGAGARGDALVSRRRAHPHDPDPDSRRILGHALARRVRRLPPRVQRAARAAAAVADRQRRRS